MKHVEHEPRLRVVMHKHEHDGETFYTVSLTARGFTGVIPDTWIEPRQNFGTADAARVFAFNRLADLRRDVANLIERAKKALDVLDKARQEVLDGKDV